VIEQLRVDLGERSYPILIGDGLLREPRRLVPFLGGRQACVVTNETVAPLFLDALRAGALSGVTLDVCVLPDGEGHKTLETYGRVIDHLMAHRHSRATTVVALGGGVVGDIAGFAAATYQRGVGFVQVPTTLLAQVDSSVGGKTGVNHPTGKNMVGAFYQPRCVLIDTATLSTLPPREFRAGIAEVVKYGIIRDRPFFEWLETHAESVAARDPWALVHVIRTSCATKASVVGADERESGERAILNFGHTFGHALEAVAGFGELLHGEAVAIGMVMAVDLSARLGRLPAVDARRVKGLLQRFGLPVRAPATLDTVATLDAMAMDKKAVDGELRLVLAGPLGRVEVVEGVARDLILRTLDGGDRLCDG
jgi:3-dehydroquinate synthase